MGLVAFLLSLPLLVPGLGHGDRTSDVTVTAAVDPGAAEKTQAPPTEAEGAGEPCRREAERSLRQSVARGPRAAGAAGAHAAVTAAPGSDRDGAVLGAGGTGRHKRAVASAPDAIGLQTFRC